ncbi:MAG: type 4a pilus biogenesis protein PilO [Candidatus Omnitrophota bacterium]|nr:type 4a pilus biogenesis protein PilO [Candidatus Omnitrophota bacterium]
MKKIIIPVILLFLFGIFIANIIYKNQTAGIKNIEANMSEERKKQSILGQIKEIEGKIKNYKPRLSDTLETHWLLENVSKMAGKAGVDLVSIKPVSSKQEGDYVFLRISLKVICGYHQLGNFISKLENSELFIKIDNMELKLVERSALVRSGVGVSKYAESPITETVLTVSAVYIK